MNKKWLAGLVFAGAIVAGCAPANITSAKWDTATLPAKAQTRCERVDMRSNSEMNETFAKYDGWKLVYISEYTTANRFGTVGVACFEREK